MSKKKEEVTLACKPNFTYEHDSDTVNHLYQLVSNHLNMGLKSSCFSKDSIIEPGQDGQDIKKSSSRLGKLLRVGKKLNPINTLMKNRKNTDDMTDTTKVSCKTEIEHDSPVLDSHSQVVYDDIKKEIIATDTIISIEPSHDIDNNSERSNCSLEEIPLDDDDDGLEYEEDVEAGEVQCVEFSSSKPLSMYLLTQPLKYLVGWEVITYMDTHLLLIYCHHSFIHSFDYIFCVN